MATVFVFLYVGVHWRHVVNTNELFVCGGDAVLSNYFDHLVCNFLDFSNFLGLHIEKRSIYNNII